jgi:hypothetical protein
METFTKNNADCENIQKYIKKKPPRQKSPVLCYFLSQRRRFSFDLSVAAAHARHLHRVRKCDKV